MLDVPISELTQVVDRLCAADPLILSDGETAVALHAQLERLSAILTSATSAFEAARSWEGDGARSAAGVDLGPLPQALG